MGDRATVSEEAGVAAIAASAGDVPRNDDEVARLDVGDARSGFDNFGHALVTDRERRSGRRATEDDRLVDVAGGCGHGPDDRVDT